MNCTFCSNEMKDLAQGRTSLGGPNWYCPACSPHYYKGMYWDQDAWEKSIRGDLDNQVYEEVGGVL